MHVHFAVSEFSNMLVWSDIPTLFSVSHQEVVDSLHSGRNIPTVLQSLGCIAQHSVSAFESQNKDITPYIYENIIQVIFCELFYISAYIFLLCCSTVDRL